MPVHVSLSIKVRFTVYRVVNGKSPPESNRPKERKKTLDDFDRCVIVQQENCPNSLKN
jgi:hypothetical protein